MKKRVFSILLALALCLTMLPAAAWAEGTSANGETGCSHTDWKYIDDEDGHRHIKKCNDCDYEYPNPMIHGDGNDGTYADGECDTCKLPLVASFNSRLTACFTSWGKAFNYINKDKSGGVYELYPITDITENVTLNASGKTVELLRITGNQAQKITVLSGTLDLYFNPDTTNENFASTISEIEVNGGTLNVIGNDLLTIEKLTVNDGTVQLSGGTYKEIEGANINDLLELGYYAVQTEDGKTSVRQAPITEVEVRVEKNDATYGYSETEAPILTANVTLRDGVTGEVTYQWYEDAVVETPIPKATGKTYTLPIDLDATGAGSIGYYCKATVGSCTVTSDPAYVTIKKAPALRLPEVNVKQVFNDTSKKTINLYDYIRNALDDLEEAANKARKTDNPIGELQFKDVIRVNPDSISSSEGMGAETGVYTYTISNNLKKDDTITITYKVGFAKDTEEESKTDDTYAKNHEDAEGTIIITLTGIVPTGTPNYTPITTEGKTLADVNLNGEFKDGDTVVPGTLEWVLEDNQTPADVTVVKGQAYKWEFTPENLREYEILTGTIIPWTENGSGTVIIITPPEQTTDNTTNPATGAAAQPALGLALLAVAAICVDSKLRRQ